MILASQAMMHLCKVLRLSRALSKLGLGNHSDSIFLVILHSKEPAIKLLTSLCDETGRLVILPT